MTRLIDADEIIKRSHDVIIGNGTKHRCFDTTLIHEIPTVDAIPVKWMRKWKDAPVSEESMDRCDTSKGDLIEWMILEWAERKEE